MPPGSPSCCRVAGSNPRTPISGYNSAWYEVARGAEGAVEQSGPSDCELR